MSKIDRSNRIVLTSLEDDEGRFCVDIYRTRDLKIFWDEWRRDPEDPSGWRATGRRAAKDFKSETEAKKAAYLAVAWLSN